uniref:Uncharacterized protein AlNc14C175G8103 n=1 Tax=Albugo laibachii Nc14 TaxID=890382 RepID=F0WNU3_9STRA|nr:hypothetical protein SELMODRAFT_450747 [Albugo laibachii Nc14]|eukprot:CCA22986.1 hypothetical protein SELMODRAFT_450747 [Albugo laibachii Nc14]
MQHSGTSRPRSVAKKSSKGSSNHRQSRRINRKLLKAPETAPTAETSEIAPPDAPKRAPNASARIPPVPKTTPPDSQPLHPPPPSFTASETPSFSLQSPLNTSIPDFQAPWLQRKAEILTRLAELTFENCTSDSPSIQLSNAPPMDVQKALHSPQIRNFEQANPHTTPVTSGNRRLLRRKRLRFGENPLLERGQYHRDYLLQEMEWMAADFAQEHKWKGKTARTLGTSLASYHRKRANLTARKEKTDMKAQRRVAGRMARDIKRFWVKIDKLVQFQHKLQADQIRKSVMDRQLKTLVLQTEQYASALAATFQKSSSHAPEAPMDGTEPRKKPSVWSFHSFQRPFLLTNRLELREYQIAGVAWLIRMCEKRINGILADEMGLGKTIQTITLLAHLASQHRLWGPHLIIVPTSCLVNWEMELKRWCPAFKVLTYFGSAKRRKLLRQGWSKPNTFHVCVTSYQLVVQDAHCFKRKKWYYVILDEAHHIKNWKSLRWQTLLTLHSQRRLLLTGTPLQNHILELWALMHFLMPHLFASRKEFTYWFQQPLSVMSESSEVDHALVTQLHGIIRPFVLRRLKKDVAKQLPRKVEHVIHCQLSRRQQSLYESFLAQSSTRSAMSQSNGNFLSLMNILMQLRKVCNHPDLFQARPIASPLDLPVRYFRLPSRMYALTDEPWRLSYACTGLVDREGAFSDTYARQKRLFVEDLHVEAHGPLVCDAWMESILNAERSDLQARRRSLERVYRLWHALNGSPVFGVDRRRAVSMPMLISAAMHVHKARSQARSEMDHWLGSSLWKPLVRSPEERIAHVIDRMQFCVCVVPKARARRPFLRPFGRGFPGFLTHLRRRENMERAMVPLAAKLVRPYHSMYSRTQMSFPDKKLVQFDCGKLQELAVLLCRLRREGHRCLIFTQMTSMLNILEQFLNLHGHTYFRLDGSTRVEKRQMLMEKFNQDSSIFCFILSTRSGGLGINLTGADTVIFYDSDWNPAMDAQAQDRAHRIGQTREVHIYRLVTLSTVEDNILRKAQQKRNLETLVMTKGQFTTDFFSSWSLCELVRGPEALVEMEDEEVAFKGEDLDLERMMANVEDEDDVIAMRDAKAQALQEELEFQDDKSVDSESIPMEGFKLEDSLTRVHQYALQYQRNATPISLQAIEHEMEAQAMERACDVERVEELKSLEDVALIEQGDLIAGVDDLQDTESYADFFKRKRSDVHFQRRKRQLTGAAWQSLRCKDTRHRFYYNVDTKQAVWDAPSILVEMEMYQYAKRYKFAGLPTRVMLGMLLYLKELHRIQSVRLVCRSWKLAADNPQLCRRLHATDAWKHAIESACVGETILLASGVYELDEKLCIRRPIRLLAAEDAHVELVMRSPTAQLCWEANGGLLQGFYLARRSQVCGTAWQHLLCVSGGVRVVYCDFDGLSGNACIAVRGSSRCISKVYFQQNRIMNGSTGILIAKPDCQVILHGNSIVQNRIAGVVVLAGHVLLKQNKIACNGRFGVRLMYHAGNVIVEDNVFSQHLCKSLDVEKSARRFVVRWNVGITRDQDETEMEPLPHHHGTVRVWTYAVKPRPPVLNLCSPYSMMQTLLKARMGLPGRPQVEYERVLMQLQSTCEIEEKIQRPKKQSKEAQAANLNI